MDATAGLSNVGLRPKAILLNDAKARKWVNTSYSPNPCAKSRRHTGANRSISGQIGVVTCKTRWRAVPMFSASEAAALDARLNTPLEATLPASDPIAIASETRTERDR